MKFIVAIFRGTIVILHPNRQKLYEYDFFKDNVYVESSPDNNWRFFDLIGNPLVDIKTSDTYWLVLE